MKKQLIIISILVIFLATGFLIFRNLSNNDLIVLGDSSILAVTDAWEVGDLVYYENDEGIWSLKSEEVSQIVRSALKFDKDWKLKLKYQFNNINEKLSGGSDSSGNIIFSGLVVLIIAAAAGLFFLFYKFLQFPKKAKTEETDDSEKQSSIGEADTNTTRIIHFFLDLYRIHMGAKKEAPTRYTRVGSQGSGKNITYELSVKIQGEWSSRRMSIGPLGEESGSKSECFYVIFDDHLVVKIPPTPVLDFENYIAGIKREGLIAEQLAPKECVVPRISIILKRIPSFAEGMGWGPDEIEGKCIEGLQRFPKFQEHLKIGGAFVFFMDLSKYFFLGNIVEKMHDVKSKLHEESSTQPDIIWEPHVFEDRFGKKNTPVCFELQNIFSQFETNLKKLLEKSGMPSALPYQTKDWFLLHLSGNKILNPGKDQTTGLVTTVNNLLSKTLGENQKPVEKYRKLLTKYIQDKTFTQNKSQIQGISTNLLELLCWLKEKGIAMRDLKPDNLLVAGDPSQYPLFLKNPEKFSIGLIDVETAVNIQSGQTEKIEQPQLGGTPYYATPSHMFENSLISILYDDLPHILHIQDWQAVIVIIYKIITGERLFQNTAKALMSVVRVMKQGFKDKERLPDMAKKTSRKFWIDAVSEFTANMAKNKRILDATEIVITDNAREMIQHTALEERQNTIRKIKRHIKNQRLFKGEKNLQKLLNAPTKNIQSFKKDWTTGTNVPKASPDIQKQMIVFLENLEELKSKLDLYGKIDKDLLNDPPAVSASNLLHLMFGHVVHIMYKEEWGPLLAAETHKFKPASDGKTFEATL